MTTIGFTINAVDRSANVFEADIWRDTQNGIGRWQVLLDPTGAITWPGLFAVDNAVSITIDGVLRMNGYVDDVRPYLDDKGYHTNLWKLTGRDYGLDLAQFFYKPLDMGGAKSDYRNTLSGDIIRDVILNLRATFGAANPEINPPAAGTGNAIDYEWTPRMNLADGFRDICLLDNHDFYIDDATLNLTYFAVGSVASGATLISYPGSATNNILALELGEQLGLDQKNYIEVFAGSLNDHYTDLNGTDNVLTGWNSGNVTCTVGNNYAGAPAPGPFGPVGFEVLRGSGKTSIYCERSVAPAANRLEMYLDFATLTTGYNQGGSINLEDNSYIRYLIIQEDTDAGIPLLGNNVSVGLQDVAGNRIYYYQRIAAPAPNKQGYTADLANNQWYEVTCHIGYDTQIAALLVGPPDFWGFDVGAAFNWDTVRYIWFSTLQASPNPSWFVIDGLQIPTVDISALSQSVVTPSPGYRMRAIDRRDIISQFELEAFADDYLDKHLKPMETLKLTTIGQTTNPTTYAGQTVEVVAPLFGIGGPLITNTVTYRILSLHHKVYRNSEESDQPGYTFLTDYDLVKDEIGDPAADQNVDPTRYYTSINPEEAWQRTRRRNENFRRTRKIRTSYAR